MKAIILLTTSILISISGCLRYTPSHTELRESSPEARDELRELGGAEEFLRYEATLRSRLNDLIVRRAHLVGAPGVGEGYPVGPGDELRVAIFGFENLTSDTGITPDGTMTLPLVGRVAVAGKPMEDVQTELSRRYSQFIRSPQVHVQLKTPINNRVSVMGEVHKPGAYPLSRKGLSLVDMLSEAGGRTPNASSRIVLLPAPTIIAPTGVPHGGIPTVSLVSSTPSPAPLQNEVSGVEIDIEDVMGGADQRPLILPLLPGDTVIIPEAGNYEVDGEVVQPGSFKLTTRTSVIGAIAAARGFTYSAAVNSVEVIRDTGGGRKALITLDLEEVGLRGGQDIRLRHGDLVRVPSEPTRFFKRQIVEAINGLFNGVGFNQRMN
jgi:polysaccharide export outer membrane protein